MQHPDPPRNGMAELWQVDPENEQTQRQAGVQAPRQAGKGAERQAGRQNGILWQAATQVAAGRTIWCPYGERRQKPRQAESSSRIQQIQKPI